MKNLLNTKQELSKKIYEVDLNNFIYVILNSAVDIIQAIKYEEISTQFDEFVKGKLFKT